MIIQRYGKRSGLQNYIEYWERSNRSMGFSISFVTKGEKKLDESTDVRVEINPSLSEGNVTMWVPKHHPPPRYFAAALTLLSWQPLIDPRV